MAKKIDSLTPAQELMVPIYLNKWLEIGRNTKRLDKEKAKAAINTVYRLGGYEPPSQHIFLDSPLQCQLAISVFKGADWSKLDSNLGSNLGSNLSSKLWTSLQPILRPDLIASLETNLASALISNLRSNIDSNLVRNLSSNLRSNLISNLGLNLSTVHHMPLCLNHWVSWVGFYDFLLEQLFPEKTGKHKNFVAYKNAVQDIGYVICFQDIVFISEHPQHLSLDTAGRLHHEIMPSMLYSDGYALFNLNGVSVPKWVIETPKDKINTADVLALTNTEQRAAVMRHVGLAYFLDSLNAEKIDEDVGYKLYYLKVENTKIGPYLHMKCPSSGREFLEGVGDPNKYTNLDPTIKTCEQALKWRGEKASNNLMTKFLSQTKWQFHA